MFNLFALLLDDPLKTATPLPMARSMKRCNSLSHSVTISCFSWLNVVNRRRWLAIWWRAPQTVHSTGWTMNVTFSRRRYVGVFLAVCDGAQSCRKHPCKMPALLLQDVKVTLDNNWDNKRHLAYFPQKKNGWREATPSTWNFGSTVPRWSESADFEPIFARSASAVTPSEKSSINSNRIFTRFPMSPS